MNGPQLRDIHLPEASFWWPPAPGWWLAALLLAAFAWLAWWLWRRRRARLSLRREALHELERIRAEYAASARHAGDRDAQALRAVASLLRRVLIGYRGRRDSAATTGEDWNRQLRALAACGFSAEQLELLAHARYRPACDCDGEALLHACENWIRALPAEVDHAAA